MKRLSSIGLSTLVFIGVTAVFNTTGSATGDDSYHLIAIVIMLWYLAIMLGEIITRMDRGERAGEEQHENGER